MVPDLDARLTRVETAAALTRAGFPTTALTLADKASRGGGPPFSIYGRSSVYVWRDVIAWAESRLTPRRTTENETKQPAAPATGASP
jgi:hypothetical protein